MDKTLDNAIATALLQAVRLLTHYFILTKKKDAYHHLSLLGDVGIAQVVNTAALEPR